MATRNDVFQRLKPACVALSQAALALNGSTGSPQAVTERLEGLKKAISIATTVPGSFDQKLADYAFFPLSQVLRSSQKVSIRSLELAFHCLAILIDQGWRSQIPAPLAGQTVILCTLMAEKNPKGLISTESTDELKTSALECLHNLFSVLDKTSETAAALNAESSFPQLGQTINTTLEAVLEGGSVEGQVAGINALQSLMSNVATQDAQVAFFPGLVSKLTKILTPQTKQRRNHVVLIKALGILRSLFLNILDEKIRTVSDKQDSASKTEKSVATVIDGKWLDIAATQLKTAVMNIVRLKDHSRVDVKEALAQLCFAILKECKTTLKSTVPIALETVLMLSAQATGEAIKFRLESITSAEPGIAELLQTTLFDWLQSLTTKMQAADEQVKVQKMQQISTAYNILKGCGIDATVIDRTLAGVLCESVTVIMQVSGTKHQPKFEAPPVQSLDIALLGNESRNVVFASPFAGIRGQSTILGVIESFAQSLSGSATFLDDLARSLRQSQGDMLIATSWLLFNAIQTALAHEGSDAFLALDTTSLQSASSRLDDLYSLSLSTLSEISEDHTDDRLQALALRVLALRARMAGEEFRFELIDALYPVLHVLATPNEELQQDSITTLNIFTEACGYGSVKDLIVDNVDYLTNAVALKLNAFDVSPQAPQVLLMMVRLAGPGLLPYLEDTVDSIFAALEDYHGYPILVELLFRVLSVIAEEGVRSPQLAVTNATQRQLTHARTERWQPMTIANLAAQLRNQSLEDARTQTDKGSKRETHPQRPWKDIGDDLSDENDGMLEESERIEEDNQVDDAEPPPPAPKTYALLLKISELTQHYLPSASASLRTSLLSLIRTTIPAIARHENSFLPLINILWPEIVARLNDSEPYVVATALDIIGLLCENAGDFMRSRVLQLWPGLVETHQNIVKDIIKSLGSEKPSNVIPKQPGSIALEIPRLSQAIARMRAVPADYSDTSTRLIWTSLVHAITAAARYVKLSPELFDQALEMLEPVLEEEEVLEAFEQENSDAVWLTRLRSGTAACPNLPLADSKINWNFVVVHG